MTPFELLSPRKLILGESTSDLLSDRGFSPDSYNLNLIKSRGKLYFIEAPTDRGSGVLTGIPICSAYDKNILGNDLYILDDEGAFYTLNGSTMTKRQTATADTFTLGTSDLLQFRGDTFATSNTRVVRLTGSDLATIDSSWWTGLSTGYRHPLERVEDTMYIGDANLIHTWNGTTSTSSAITLPTDVNITSLRKHPDGRSLIAFCGLTQNYSHTKGQGGRIYIIDTVLNDWTREIEVESQVEGSRLVGGTVYVTFGFRFGYFTGDGIKSIRPLNTSQTTYSHCISNLDDIVCVRDGLNVLAYGDLGAGNVWWNMYKNDINASNISLVAYKGDNKMCFGHSDGSGGGNLYETDYDNAGTFGIFFSNKIDFPGETKIRRLNIIHDVSNPAGNTSFGIYARDPDDSGVTLVKQQDYTVATTTTKTRIETDISTDVFQIRLNPSTYALGFRYIKGFYQFTENE